MAGDILIYIYLYIYLYTYIYLWLIHAVVKQKLTHRKAIILQLKINLIIKKIKRSDAAGAGGSSGDGNGLQAEGMGLLDAQWAGKLHPAGLCRSRKQGWRVGAWLLGEEYRYQPELRRVTEDSRQG